MTSGEANRRDATVRAGYRAAAEVLGERASEATRAAILAAAARAVQAHPQDAQSDATSTRSAHERAPRPRAGLHRAWFTSPRPLALAASVLVGSVALLLATRTQQEQEVAEPKQRADTVRESQGNGAPAPAATATRAREQAAAPASPPAAVTVAPEPEARAKVPARESEPAPALRGDERAARAASNEAAGARTQVRPLGKEAQAPMRDKREAVREEPPQAFPLQERPAASALAQSRSEEAGPSKRSEAATPTPAGPQASGAGTQQIQATDRVQAADRPPAAQPATAGGAPGLQSPQAASSGALSDGLPRPPAPAASSPELRRAAPGLRDRLHPEAEVVGGQRRLPAERAGANAGKLGEESAGAQSVEAGARQDTGEAQKIEAQKPAQDRALENDAQRWLARIVQLRHDGRDDEADRELKRLRERYPEAVIPEGALRRTGTR